MRKYILFFVYLFLVNHLMGQVSVTFQLDVADLNRMGCFSYDSGDRVFIRGSFNDWKDTVHELKQTSDPDIFSGMFCPGNIGDTISYIFVIQKGEDHLFREVNPNPDNPDNGNRQLVIDKNTLVLSPARFSYDEYICYPVIFSKEKLREDFIQFRDILESTHPALYDYTQKEVLDSAFDSNFNKINSDLEFNDFLILMTEVISKVGCGHSSLWVPRKFWKVAPGKLFPLKLLMSGDKIVVKSSYDNSQEIPVGSEIVAINGQPVNQVIERLASLTSADGFNPSYRMTKATGDFPVKYAHAFGFPGEFVVDYRIPGSIEKVQKTVPPVSKEAVDRGNQGREELSFRMLKGTDTGVLTINTFSYYDKVDMFHAFIDSVFRETDQKNITDLILDLRGNGGGDPFCAAYLWSYLQPESLPYFEDHYGKYDTLANPIPMPKRNFKGNLFTLIDGNGFSTTGHFCGLLKYHKVGTFIGTELGATYSCTGNATYPALKHTGIMVGTARVRRYTAAVKEMELTRGVMPDYTIEPTQEDIIAGNDPVLEFAISLAKSR